MMSKNTTYFSHDFNARNDERIIALRMELGMEGYGIYFAIIEKLGEAQGHVLGKDYNIIAFELRVSSQKVKMTVENFDLFQFTDSGKYFYSDELIQRMIEKEDIREKRREAGRKGAMKRWGESK